MSPCCAEKRENNRLKDLQVFQEGWALYLLRGAEGITNILLTFVLKHPILQTYNESRNIISVGNAVKPLPPFTSWSCGAVGASSRLYESLPPGAISILTDCAGARACRTTLSFAVNLGIWQLRG